MEQRCCFSSEGLGNLLENDISVIRSFSFWSKNVETAGCVEGLVISFSKKSLLSMQDGLNNALLVLLTELLVDYAGRVT